MAVAAIGPLLIQGLDVGWVKRSETQHECYAGQRWVLGFADSTQPTGGLVFFEVPLRN